MGIGGILGAGGVHGRGATLPLPVLPSVVLQSVLCGADALIPVQTGAAGSASLTLLGNGSLIYQVRVRECRRWEGSRGCRALPCNGSGAQAFFATPVCPPWPCPPGTGSWHEQ